ncbi:hypothetical protein DERP_002950 [Dermatophagoides pteronyssinus]|uniref:Uncharacterized protein n=1 Tax=Dermatophagoides pteronyssinus TaxID=6956 RepID=A0ABQ8JWP6_DERPT|nr:hypothetical protein DERP_002950 [Dermatophagoides pteronyssinus]
MPGIETIFLSKFSSSFSVTRHCSIRQNIFSTTFNEFDKDILLLIHIISLLLLLMLYQFSINVN